MLSVWSHSQDRLSERIPLYKALGTKEHVIMLASSQKPFLRTSRLTRLRKYAHVTLKSVARGLT